MPSWISAAMTAQLTGQLAAQRVEEETRKVAMQGSDSTIATKSNAITKPRNQQMTGIKPVNSSQNQPIPRVSSRSKAQPLVSTSTADINSDKWKGLIS